MCNPPFYSSAEDIDRSAAGKEADPFSVSFQYLRCGELLMRVVGVYGREFGDDYGGWRGHVRWEDGE
jgi:hypothetical protein